MSTIHSTVLYSLTLVMSLSPVQPAQATEPSDEAARLVRKLGSPDYQERESADADLLRLGESALPALEQGLKSSDPEIRSRCERLVSKIRSAIRRKAEEVRKESEEKRFREFVRSGLQTQGKSTPSWERLQKLIDTDPQARVLLTELHEYDPAFLKLALNTPERVPTWASTRRKELTDEAWRLLQAGQNPALIRPKVRIMVKQALVLPNPDLDLLDQTFQFGKPSELERDPEFASLYRLRLSEQFDLLAKRGTIDTSVVKKLSDLARSLGMQKELKDAVRPVTAAAINRVLVGPFDKRTRSEAVGLLRLAEPYEVEGIAPVALRVGLSKEFDAKTRAKAIYLVGKYGTKAQIEPLNQLLGDRTQLSAFGQVSVNEVNFTSYLGDEALAAMVHLSGGDLADYGFGKPGVPNPTYRDRSWEGWGHFGPTDDAIDVVRQNAILKWKARQKPF